MNFIIAITVGVLTSAGFYRLLGRGKLNIIIGLILLGQGINLLILGSSRLTHNAPALLSDNDSALSLADPLPQALVLTAIVIGFGIVSFMISLVIRK